MITRVVQVLATLVLASACAARRPAPMPPAAAALIVAPFCVAGVLRVDGLDVDGRVCWSELRFCERARTDAIAYGALFGLVSIGECVRAE